MIDAKTVIKTVTLKVADLEKMADFYQNIIGLQVHERTCKRVILGSKRHGLLHLHHRPDGQVVWHKTGLYHLALCLPTYQDLAHWFRHYHATGMPGLQGASDHQISRAVYLADPEGNGVEMCWDTPAAGWSKSHNGQIGVMSYPLNLSRLYQDAPTTPWLALSPAATLGHIHLSVPDTESAQAFYVDLLGFHTTLSVANHLLFVAAGDYHHHIGFNTWESAEAAPADENAYGLESFSIGLSCHAEQARLIERLQEIATPITYAGNHAVINDPFGIPVHLEVYETT